MKKRAVGGFSVCFLILSLSSTPVSRAEENPWFPWWPPSSIHDWMPPAIGCATLLAGWYARGAREALRGFAARRRAVVEADYAVDRASDAVVSQISNSRDGWSVVRQQYERHLSSYDFSPIDSVIYRILIHADFGAFTRRTEPDSQAAEISQRDFEQMSQGVREQAELALQGVEHFEAIPTRGYSRVPLEGLDGRSAKYIVVGTVQLRYGGTQGVLVLTLGLARIGSDNGFGHYYRIEGFELEPKIVVGAAG